MTGVSLTIAADDLGLRSAAMSRLLEVEQRAADLSPALDDIGMSLAMSTLQRFKTGAAPDGTAWLPAARGGQTLVKQGHLRDSITHQVRGQEVAVGSTVEYAAIHQFGGVIEPRHAAALVFQVAGGGFARVKKVTMPARPYLGLSADDETEIGAIIEDHMMGDGS